MADEVTSPAPETAPETACERAMARYRKALGEHWQTADEMLFRCAWSEGAQERYEQMRAEQERLWSLLAAAKKETTR